MKNALIIQTVPFEDLGHFAPLLAQHYQCHTIEAPISDFDYIDPLSADLWVVLGGPIGVYQSETYPFLKPLKAALKQRVQANLPTLGICLGCQLIADVLGAKVYPSGYQEIGWKPIQLTAAGQQSCLAALDNQTVLHWHGDTFDLPQGATLLASSDVCQQQAFQIGNVLGLQFHPEVTAQGLERWFVAHTHELHSLSLSIQQLRADSQTHADNLQAQGKLVLNQWLAQLS